MAALFYLTDMLVKSFLISLFIPFLKIYVHRRHYLLFFW